MNGETVAMLLSNAYRPDPRVQKEARALARAGYRVAVICWDRRGEFAPVQEQDGFAVRRICVRSGYSAGSRQILHLPRFWWRAVQELRTLRPDLIHAHDLDTAPAAAWYAAWRRIPWIFDAHECYPEQIRPQVHPLIYRLLLILERQMARRATRVLTVGELLAERFRTMGGRVAVIGNYQAREAFLPKRAISREDLGLRPNDYVVAYIGGFTAARAILPLIAATDLCRDVTVLLLGDGPQRAAIETALPSHPRVRYLGLVPQEDVADYTALADVIYYGLYAADGNSRYSSPNALFNALAAGKPLLTTDVGEIARIVRQEACGIVVAEPTPALLADALARLADPAVRLPLAENARRAGETKYHWRVAEETLLCIYRHLLRG